MHVYKLSDIQAANHELKIDEQQKQYIFQAGST